MSKYTTMQNHSNIADMFCLHLSSQSYGNELEPKIDSHLQT